jgi:hypothetical protein
VLTFFAPGFLLLAGSNDSVASGYRPEASNFEIQSGNQVPICFFIAL